MKINQILINILNEIDNNNAEQIVEKYLKDAEVETKIDAHDLLVQMIKTVEKHMFSGILSVSASVESGN